MQSRGGGKEQEQPLIPRMCSWNRVKYLSTVRDGKDPGINKQLCLLTFWPFLI